MSSLTDIPNFARVLGPFITPIPDPSRPALLCHLERLAASRYREWADEASPEDRDGLLACSEREEEIARRVTAHFPAQASDGPAIEENLAGARAAYAEVFEGKTLREKFYIQAGAERQGAAAWRLIASQQADEDVKNELEACAKLEEDTASHLEKLLGLPQGATAPAPQ